VNEFYNYIYLDPRKPGHYTYDNTSFLYQPFYVGKGKNNRYLDHVHNDHRNKLKTNVINKILNEGFDLKKYIVIIYKELSEQEAFENEIFLIKEIGRRINKTGSLCNMDEGGKGSDSMSHHPDKDEIYKKIRLTQIKNKNTHKGKTYEELYGDRAKEEKEKRRQALLGKKHSKERRIKSGKSHKGQIAWNKGLDKNDPRVLKYIENRKPKKFFKIYNIKNIKTNEVFSFNGKEKLEKFVKIFNKELKLKSRINIDVLIKEEKDKNFIVINKELDNGNN